VIVPALPGIVTYGRTIEEAREMARDAISCHLQGLLKDDEEIPKDPFAAEPPVIEDLKIAVLSPLCLPSSRTCNPNRLFALSKGGFYVHETSGSHVQMKHPTEPGRVTIPYHKRFDLPKHIVKSIVRQAGLTNQEFFGLLKSC